MYVPICINVRICDKNMLRHDTQNARELIHLHLLTLGKIIILTCRVLCKIIQKVVKEVLCWEEVKEIITTLTHSLKKFRIAFRLYLNMNLVRLSRLIVKLKVIFNVNFLEMSEIK